jgi:hypothetical protein
VFGKPALRIDRSTTDEPVPSGVAPYRLRASPRSLTIRRGARATLQAWVTSADGARLTLDNPLSRVAVRVADPATARVVVRAGGAARVIGGRVGSTTIRLTYQRKRAHAGYSRVFDGAAGKRRLVAITVRVRVRPG